MIFRRQRCRRCGWWVEAAAPYCPHCGTRLSDQAVGAVTPEVLSRLLPVVIVLTVVIWFGAIGTCRGRKPLATGKPNA